MAQPAAFPVPMIPIDNTGGYGNVWQQGMSLRDWYAGLAMQAWLKNSDEDAPHMGQYAMLAFDMADKMMEQANSRP